MMKQLFFVLLIFVSANLFAQHITADEHFFTEDLFMNPAYVGTSNYAPARATVMQKYAGLGDASPTTALLSLHTRIGQGYFRGQGGLINKYPELGKIAVGGYIHSFNYGPQHMNNLNLVYGYHLPLHYKFERTLVFALTTGYRNQLFNVSQLEFRNPNDPIFKDDFVSANMFNSDIAVLYKTSNLEVGGGVKNLVLTKNQLEYSADYDQMSDYKRSYFGNVRYIVRNKKYWLDFKPTLFVKYDSDFNPEILGNLELEMDQTLTIGCNVHHRNLLAVDSLSTLNTKSTEFVAYASVTFNKFKYQYGFSTNFNELSTFSAGTHYITVGYNIGQKFERGPLNKLRKPILFRGINEKYDAYKNYKPGE